MQKYKPWEILYKYTQTLAFSKKTNAACGHLCSRHDSQYYVKYFVCSDVWHDGIGVDHNW